MIVSDGSDEKEFGRASVSIRERCQCEHLKRVFPFEECA